MKTLILVVVLAFLYFVFGKLSFFFLSNNYFISIGIFASEGIALAFALYFGKRVIPGIFLGQFALAYSNGLDIGASTAIALVNSTEAYLGLWILTQLKLDIRLRTFRDFGLLFAVIIFVLQPFSGFLSNAYLAYNGDISPGTYIDFSLDWIIGNTVGQFLFTPFLLLLFTNSRHVKWLHFLLFGMATGLFSYLLVIVIKIENPFLLFNLTFPVAVLVVSRWGLFYGTFFNVLVAEIAAYSVEERLGAFFLQSQMNNVVNYDLFILAHIAIVIIAGVLFDERKRHEKNLQLTISREVEKNKKHQILMLQQSRLAQMGEMISMIAHQWKQPLNSLFLMTQILEKRYYQGRVDHAYMERFGIKSSELVEHMSGTIDDFRHFFKPEKEKSVFLLNDVVTHAVEIVEPVLEEALVDIDITTESEVHTYGYRNELGQAIINILNNAKDALVEHRETGRRIEISISTKEEKACLSILDNAGGIPEEIRPRIFEPYFSTKEEKNGTGLGLYMTKIIIEEHSRGKLTVSNQKEGAMFEILLLPAKDSD